LRHTGLSYTRVTTYYSRESKDNRQGRENFKLPSKFSPQHNVFQHKNTGVYPNGHLFRRVNTFGRIILK